MSRKRKSFKHYHVYVGDWGGSTHETEEEAKDQVDSDVQNCETGMGDQIEEISRFGEGYGFRFQKREGEGDGFMNTDEFSVWMEECNEPECSPWAAE
jgi:hypothetical protein